LLLVLVDWLLRLLGLFLDKSTFSFHFYFISYACHKDIALYLSQKHILHSCGGLLLYLLVALLTLSLSLSLSVSLTGTSSSSGTHILFSLIEWQRQKQKQRQSS